MTEVKPDTLKICPEPGCGFPLQPFTETFHGGGRCGYRCPATPREHELSAKLAAAEAQVRELEQSRATQRMHIAGLQESFDLLKAKADKTEETLAAVRAFNALMHGENEFGYQMAGIGVPGGLEVWGMVKKGSIEAASEKWKALTAANAALEEKLEEVDWALCVWTQGGPDSQLDFERATKSHEGAITRETARRQGALQSEAPARKEPSMASENKITQAEWKYRFKAELIRIGFDESFAEDCASASPPDDWAGYTPEDAAREEVSYGD